jgi:acyl dehydratase
VATSFAVGDVHTAVVVDHLTRTQIVQYAGASGDFNPIHTDETFATTAAGYPSVFAHGMLTMGMTGHLLTDLVGDGHLTQFGGRFTAQVWPGDTLTASATVTGIDAREGHSFATFEVATTNQDDIIVFQGTAEARVA